MDLKNDSPQTPRPSSPPDGDAHVYLRIQGRVQGVGFRYFAEEKATALGLKGWVRNLPDGDVDAEAEGPRPVIEQWIKEIRKGPPFARVEDVQSQWSPALGQFSEFTIRL